MVPTPNLLPLASPGGLVRPPRSEPDHSGGEAIVANDRRKEVDEGSFFKPARRRLLATKRSEAVASTPTFKLGMAALWKGGPLEW